jgi:hypothetical protein
LALDRDHGRLGRPKGDATRHHGRRDPRPGDSRHPNRNADVYTCSDVNADGYTCSHVDADGYTCSDVDADGYTRSDVNADGYTRSDVNTDGYTRSDVNTDIKANQHPYAYKCTQT